MRQRVTVSSEDGEPTGEHPLRDEEIVSIVRNWTGSDLGSIALCAGVLVSALTTMPSVAERLRVGTYAEACASTRC